MTAVESEPTAGTGERPAWARPWLVLLAAAIVGVASAVIVGIGWPVALGIVGTLAAIAVTVWGTWVAVRWPSLVVAPLAICLVALANPLSLGGLHAHIEHRFGLVVVGPGGVVFWSTYPGIAGWEAPPDPAPVDTTTLARTVQSTVRGVVETLTDEFGFSWQIGEGDAGVATIPNGFGGLSSFDRVDSGLWTTPDLDGSDAQRATTIAAVEEAATTLALTEASDVSGDVATGDGERAWTDGTGTLTLRIEGGQITLWYVGGPFLTATSIPGEYERRMEGFAGQTPPEPLFLPDVP